MRVILMMMMAMTTTMITKMSHNSVSPFFVQGILQIRLYSGSKMAVSYCHTDYHTPTGTILPIWLHLLSNHPRDIFTYNQPDYRPPTTSRRFCCYFLAFQKSVLGRGAALMKSVLPCIWRRVRSDNQAAGAWQCGVPGTAAVR